MNHTSNTAAGMTAFLDAEMIPPLAAERWAQSASTVDGDRYPASTGPRGAGPAATGRRPPIADTNWVMLLFLMWAAITPVRATEVSYNANGATSGTVPAAQTKTYNEAVTLATNSGNLARPGYTFVGWNTAANGSGTDYAVSTNYNVNAPVTLYAKWTAAADNEHGISGEWEMESEANGRLMVSTLTFASGARGAITGKWGSTDLSNMKFDGRKLTFVRTMKFGDQEFSMNFAGIWKAGKVIAGTVSNDQGEFMIIGIHRHEDPAPVGQWDLSYRYGDQDMTAKLAVSQNARGAIDAKWTSQRDESALSGFKVSGGVLTFARKIKFNDKEFETTFECRFAGDKLTGRAKSERGEIPVTGQRRGGALVGKWELTSTSDRGPRRNLLTIRGDLSGRYETFGEIPIQDPKLEGSEIPIQDLKLEGNQVSFKVVTTFQGQTREPTFNGTLDGNTLKGQITSQNGTREVTGKKVGGPWALFWE
jgi:uncharacterized repeat protein (TIGR02543 family)